MDQDLPSVDRRGLPRVRREWDGRRVSVLWSVKRGNLRRCTRTSVLNGVLCATDRDDLIGVRLADGTVKQIHYTRVLSVTLLDATAAQRARERSQRAARAEAAQRAREDAAAQDNAVLTARLTTMVDTGANVTVMLHFDDRPARTETGVIHRDQDHFYLHTSSPGDRRVLPVVTPATRLINAYDAKVHIRAATPER